jgi:3-oxoadipate enol-lactonase
MQLYYTLHNPDKPETVVLLHGLGSSSDDWELQLPALTPRYRVLAPDLRGHGRSPKPRGRYDLAVMTADLADLLDRLGLPAAHVVGLSLGGALAQGLAAAYPKRVKSLVLVNTFARVRPTGLSGVVRFFRRVAALQFGTPRDLGKPVIDAMFPKPEQAVFRQMGLERFTAYNTDKDVYKAMLAAVVRYDFRPKLSAIRCPCLVVAGDRDRTVPMACKTELRDSIPGARLALIRDSGHATPIDQADEFNRLLTGFLTAASLPSPTTSS